MNQRELVRAFDEKLHTYVSNGMEPVEKFFKGFFLVLVGMVMLLPYDTQEKGMFLMFWGFGIFGASMALVGKLNVTENGKQKTIYQKLKYVPVAKKEIWRVRVGYIVEFLKVHVVVALVAQLLGAWLFNGRIGIENVIYPLIVQGVWPFLFGLLMTFEMEFDI